MQLSAPAGCSLQPLKDNKVGHCSYVRTRDASSVRDIGKDLRGSGIPDCINRVVARPNLDRNNCHQRLIKVSYYKVSKDMCAIRDRTAELRSVELGTPKRIARGSTGTQELSLGMSTVIGSKFRTRRVQAHTHT